MTDRKNATSSIDYDVSFTALCSPEIRDTVFAADTCYSTLQVGVECARLAYFRAEVSAAQYQRLSAALTCIGFGPPTLLLDAATGTEGFAAKRSSDAMALIAIRGSSPSDVTDGLTNLCAGSVRWHETAGYVHAGFAAAARAILPQIRDWLDRERAGSELVLTGHSLGAAVATLVASVVRPSLLVSLGSPRVGDRTFAHSLNGVTIERVVNCCDAVTEAPPELPWYTHVGKHLYLTRTGMRIERPDDRFISRDRVQARLEFLSQSAWRSGSLLLRDIADHAPINYVRGFFP